MSKDNPNPLEVLVIEKIKEVYDPEIPINVYDLGLIYRVEDKGNIFEFEIDMTLTSPVCPVVKTLPLEVQIAAQKGVNEFLGIDNIKVDKILKLLDQEPVPPREPILKSVCLKALEIGRKHVKMNLTFDPPFTMAMLSEEARHAMGFAF